MLDYINDESPEVRQASSYGIGVMAVSAPQEFAQVIQGLLSFFHRKYGTICFTIVTKFKNKYKFSNMNFEII